jgi:dTDP-4-dehydrorhamnose reductase
MEIRLIVLGSGGYLGRALCVELEQCLDGERLVRVRGTEDLQQEGIRVRRGDTVVNCVGYYGGDRARLHAANVDHSARAAEAARAAGAALVHVSSAAVFDGISHGRLSETTPIRPRSAYGRSKAEAESIVARILPGARIARPSKLFGGDDPRCRLHALMRHVARGRPLPLPKRPALWANFAWVRDAAVILAREVLEPSGDRVIHLATPVPWEEFSRLLGQAAGRPVRRAPRGLELAPRLAVPLLAATPGSRPRRAERLLELWDRREFVDSGRRFPPESLTRGLAEVAAAAR